MDVLVLGITIVFFAGTILYMIGCDRLGHLK